MHNASSPTVEHTYEEFVNDKFKSMPSAKEDLLHAAVGISGESGEVLDLTKKHYFYNKPLNRNYLVEELGDLEFYMQALRMCLQLDRNQIIRYNMVKLSKRYASGSYSDAQAQARLDKVTPVASVAPVVLIGSKQEPV